MKYGQQLLAQQNLKWASKYISYNNLKRQLTAECKLIREVLTEANCDPPNRHVSSEEVQDLLISCHKIFEESFSEEIEKAKNFYIQEIASQSYHICATEEHILYIKKSKKQKNNNLKKINKKIRKQASLIINLKNEEESDIDYDQSDNELINNYINWRKKFINKYNILSNDIYINKIQSEKNNETSISLSYLTNDDNETAISSSNLTNDENETAISSLLLSNEDKKILLSQYERILTNKANDLEKLSEFLQINDLTIGKIIKKRKKKIDKIFKEFLNNSSYECPIRKALILFGCHDGSYVTKKVKDQMNDIEYRTINCYRFYDSTDEGGEVSKYQKLSEGLIKLTEKLYDLCCGEETSEQKLRMLTQRRMPDMSRLFFFLGVSITLLLNIGILCILPSTNINYTETELLANVPIFRFWFMWTLLFWVAGLVIYWSENFGINHVYLLNIEPKCVLKAGDLFNVAVVQSFMWIVTFGLFVADYKFLIFGLHSNHYFYPLALVLSQIILIYMPSRIFRRSHRKDIFMLVWGTIICGLNPTAIGVVTFPANIMGDILTSFVKPMADLEYIICYFLSGFYRLIICFFNFKFKKIWSAECGNITFESILYHSEMAKCPILDEILLCVIIFVPYWVRLIQCYHRIQCSKTSSKVLQETCNRCSTLQKEKYKVKIREEKDFQNLQLANCGKYILSLAAICIAQANFHGILPSTTSKYLVIISLIAATLYSFYWDIVNDWGFLCNGKYLRDRRLLPDHYYYVFTVLNLIGRSSWALTILPIEIIDNKSLNKALIICVISALEVYRRAQWLIVRLDFEHLENKSKFRSLLYVPKLPKSCETPPSEDNISLLSPTLPNRKILPKRYSPKTFMKRLQSQQPPPPLSEPLLTNSCHT
eukprot:GHVL01043862.1.p1 GENE.GHVL01043862.1~~GHVL01043862.1.p1  ORF type:complete len:884 (-),score=172.23 GHVL01043862.1:1744-4395(-)